MSVKNVTNIRSQSIKNPTIDVNDNSLLLTQIHEQEPILDGHLKHQLLKGLENEVLQRIKKGFDLYKGTVRMGQFIAIMTNVLYPQVNWHHHTREVLTFIELFLLIDLKNLQRIRFEDFTNYLIERQGEESKQEQCQFFSADKLNNLDLQAQKVFVLSGSEKLATLDASKKSVHILQQKTYKCIETISFGGVLINNIVYLSKYNVYCLATNDKYLSFYESAENTLLCRFSVPDSLFFLLVVPGDHIVAGATNGHIYQFSLRKILGFLGKKDKQAQLEEQLKRRHLPPHDQYKHYLVGKASNSQPDLTCLDALEAVELLITGSNDSKVRLYEMRQQGLLLRKQLQGHYKGVKGVAVSAKQKLIVSCSFDFDVLIWNAYLEHPVARLLGHQAPLMNVCCPLRYQIILSLDAKAVMKIWNAENYQLIQNIVILENFPGNSSISFVYKNETSLAIVFTKRLRFYEYVVNYNPKLTDDADVSAIRYSPRNLQVYIGSKRALKIWDITTGLQKKTYKDIIASDISIIQLDSRERRCFLGSVQGHIVSVDLFSGLVINSYSSHLQQISILLYSNQHKLLITGGWDKQVKIHNDTQHLERIEARDNVMRNITGVGEKDLHGGCFSSAQLLIATHCKTNVVRLWDFQKGFLESQIVVGSEVALSAFVDPLPLLVVVDVKGTISLFSTKYHLKQPYQLLTQWKNIYSIQKSSQITFITSNYTNNGIYELILGDQYGYLRIVDISLFVSQNILIPVAIQKLGNKNPYRIEDYHFMGSSQHSQNTYDFSHVEPNSIVPPASIKQRIQIKAHTDRVNYVAMIREGKQYLILSAGSDNLVRLWNQKGEQRGTMRQGVKENKGWTYEMNKQWTNRQTVQFHKIRKALDADFKDYSARKRKEVIPFTQQARFEEATNDQIYKDLKEVEGYFQKVAKKQGRLY